MTSKQALRLFVLLSLILTSAGTETRATQPILPNPVLYLMNTELYTQGGKQFIRYRFDVANKNEYPDALFAPAPALPPCGQNKNSARTWVTVYDQSGKRLQAFCVFGKPADLGSIWFALEEGVLPPSYIYIEMHDRQTDTKYKSNLADTVI